MIHVAMVPNWIGLSDNQYSGNNKPMKLNIYIQ